MIGGQTDSQAGYNELVASWVSPQTNATYTMSVASGGASLGTSLGTLGLVGDSWNQLTTAGNPYLQQGLIQQPLQPLQPAVKPPWTDTITDWWYKLTDENKQFVRNLTKTTGDSSMAKLIQYTVVDPDVEYAKKNTGTGIILSGTRLITDDERSFLMELAPTISMSAGFAEHNAARELTEYEDKDGKTRMFKPVRLGQLDVVIVTLKEYLSK